MKGVPKNLKEISSARRMAICKSYAAIGNMAAQLAKCKSAELQAGLKNAKLLCAVKKHGSGSGAKKPATGKPKPTGKSKPAATKRAGSGSGAAKKPIGGKPKPNN